MNLYVQNDIKLPIGYTGDHTSAWEYTLGETDEPYKLFFWDTYGPQTQHKMLVFWMKTCISLYTVK